MAWHIAIDEPKSFEFLEPVSVDEALEMATRYEGHSAYLAGGCDLLDQLKHQLNNPSAVINLKNINGLRGVELRQKDGVVRVGALTTLAELERDDTVRHYLTGYALAAGRVATPQIRNLGTAGGNLLQDSRCPYYRGPWYCYRAGGIVCDAHHGLNNEHALFGHDRCYTVTPSDTAPVLAALGATALTRAPGGGREIPLEDLFVLPKEDITTLHRLKHDEILAALQIPVRKKRKSTFVKYAVRNSWDFAAASVACAFDDEGGRVRNARIFLGAVATIPWRARGAEQVVEGERLTPAVIERAAEAAVEGADPPPYSEYKVGMVKKGVRHVLTELAK
ncbi:MAG TPA: xanthine dehydrogenase family protein subunit M [Longimicrobiaceae bacterium]|nr:xanthine dehydrogenase family protein subunit M [Longimicrobiaceae bacterium]